MKTTLDIPDATLRQAESLAAAKGIPLTQFLAETLEEQLRRSNPPATGVEPRWMRGFGALRDLKQENAQVARWIDEEFERIEPEDS